MKLRIISGGQTGADRGALDAAMAAGIPCGGWCPKGRKAEDGRIPDRYPLVEMDTDSYPARTLRNVADAQACIWFGNPHSPGGRLTLGACTRERVIDTYTVLFGESTPRAVADWLAGVVLEGETGTVTVMVAGNRESIAPFIHEKTEQFLVATFALLRAEKVID